MDEKSVVQPVVKSDSLHRRLGRKTKQVLISLAALAAVYAIINVVLVGGQKMIDHGDQSKLNSLKAELSAEKPQLDALYSTIDSQGSYLTTTKEQMDKYSEAGQVSAYNSLVDQYNGTLDSYKANIDSYNSRAPAYNAKVDEANKLAKKVGTTYYVVPIPTGRSK